MSLNAPNRLLAVIALLTAALAPSSYAIAHMPVAEIGDAASPRVSQAHAAPAEARPSKQASLEAQLLGDHIARHPRPVSERAPHQPVVPDARAHDYSQPVAKSELLARPSTPPFKAATASECDLSRFTSLSGTALSNAVRGASVACINETFALSGSQAHAAFREAQMISVADAFRVQAAAYDGSNGTGILQLILYLRAGYYVQFYDPAVGSYGSALANALRPAMDSFAGSSRFGLINGTHGEILAEFVTLVDSSGENARYLDSVVRRLLDSYDTRFDSHYWMLVAVNNAFTVTFRGHQNPAFRTLVQADPRILDVLYGFADRNWARLGGQQDYLVANAARELARFLQYSGNLKSLASVRAKTLADRASITGNTAKVWIGIGEMVDHYDRGNCAYYGFCDFANRVRSTVLPMDHGCSSQLRIRAQSMAPAELAWTCQQTAGIDDYFHTRLATQRLPVADDFNTALEMVVFDSSGDYQTYAGAIYGIDTNNGGMYLEGNPATPGNQARFIAYEAEWRRPTFEIWNLHHEYVHYLDGRYNLYGDFSRSISQRTVWWIEGLAEYIAYGFRNLSYANALGEASRGTHALGTIYQNDYNSGSTRVYAWGYLAVRFMFEQRPSQVSQILSRLRGNDYSGYASLMSQIGGSNNAAFAAWLPCVANPAAGGCGGGDTQPPSTPGTLIATVRSSSQIDLGWTASSDSGGSGLAGYRIERCQGANCTDFASIATSTAPPFANSGLAAGTIYRYRVRAFDGAGNHSAYSNVASATTGSTGGGTALQNGAPVHGLAAGTGSALHFSIDVPAGASALRFEIAGGSGDADLYVRFGQAASTVNYDCRPFLSGNNEVCTIATPQAGRYHVMLHAYRSFADVGLTARFEGGGIGSLPICSASDPRELGRNCRRAGLGASGGQLSYHYLRVPAGVGQLRIRSANGTGNADLYVNLSGWASPGSHHYRSTGSGNSETLVLNNPPEGILYISLHAQAGFSGVELATEY